MNKRGTDKILSLYWFVILTLVAGGIIGMVYVFYGAPYDTRGIESQLLVNRIADCVSGQGKINPNFFSETGFDSAIQGNLLEECNLNFDVESGYEEGVVQYFFEIDFYTLEELSEPSFKLEEGNLNWKTGCFINRNEKNEYANLVKCTERRLYALDESNNQYLIKILAGVGKFEKNVKK